MKIGLLKRNWIIHNHGGILRTIMTFSYYNNFLISMTDGLDSSGQAANPPVGNSTGSGGLAASPSSATSSSGATTSSAYTKLVKAANGKYMQIENFICSGIKELHHIVEQCQRYKSKFSRTTIYDGNNIIEIPYDAHRKISGLYSSKQSYSEGKRVRDWLAGQSYEDQKAGNVKSFAQY